MRNEKEIREVTAKLTKDLEAYLLCGLRGEYTTRQHEKIKILQWILEPPECKKTIFDLTEEEMLKLMEILTPQEPPYSINIKSIHKRVEENVLAVICELTNNVDDFGYHTYVYINAKNLDVAISDSEGKKVDIQNILKYADTIRRMLSE